MNRFYVYMVGNKFVKVTRNMNLRLVTDIDKCTYWFDKRKAKTWKFIYNKYPTAEMVTAKLTLNS